MFILGYNLGAGPEQPQDFPQPRQADGGPDGRQTDTIQEEIQRLGGPQR